MGMSWGLRRSTFFCCEDVHPISHRCSHLSNLNLAVLHEWNEIGSPYDHARKNGALACRSRFYVSSDKAMGVWSE